MKIAVLSRNRQLYSTRRLVEAARNRGHDVQVIDYIRCYMNINKDKQQIHYQGEILEHFESIIPRIGAGHTFYGTAIVRQFEIMGTYSPNPSLAISRARNKLHAQQLLAMKNVGLPITGFAHSPDDIEDLIKIAGGAPVVIKLLEGTQGVGVVLAETKKAASSVIQAFMGLNANIIVQEFIHEARGSDIRCFVIGDKVVAAIKRQAKEGEFRSNIHRGGTAVPIKITKEERETAILAAKVMGLRIAGVDLLRSDKGPLVLEVNSTPGLEGIETATGKDIATLIIKHLEKKIEGDESTAH